MQTAAGLLSALGDCIEAIKAHLTTMESATLDELIQSLPSRTPAGSAQMVMLVLVYREMAERRECCNHTSILPFAPVKRL